MGKLLAKNSNEINLAKKRFTVTKVFCHLVVEHVPVSEIFKCPIGIFVFPMGLFLLELGSIISIIFPMGSFPGTA